MMTQSTFRLSTPCVTLAAALVLAACGSQAGGSAGVQTGVDSGAASSDGGADSSTTADVDNTDSGSATVDAGNTSGAQDAAPAADAGGATDAAADVAVAVDAGSEPDIVEPKPDVVVAPDTGSAPDTATTGWGAGMCPVGGKSIGFGVGQELGDLPIQDCDTGVIRSIKEVCGAKATWIFVAHTHCPTCRATAQYTAKVAKQLVDKDVAVVHVVHVDDYQSCPSWRKKYGLEGIDNLRVYLDKSGAAWNAIKTKNYTAPHAFAGPNRVITYKQHGLSSNGVLQKVNQALASK